MLTKDAKVGDLNLKAEDDFMVSMRALHYNANEWQKPHQFIPERFDTSNPISLTPNGKKRNPVSHSPFSGGARKCLGKSLAESTMIMIASYLSQHFNFEFVDKKFENILPTCTVGMSRHRAIEIRLTKYED